jgi:hypothetical protein
MDHDHLVARLYQFPQRPAGDGLAQGRQNRALLVGQTGHKPRPDYIGRVRDFNFQTFAPVGKLQTHKSLLQVLSTVS